MTSWLSQHPIVVMGLWDGAKICSFWGISKFFEFFLNKKGEIDHMLTDAASICLHFVYI